MSEDLEGLVDRLYSLVGRKVRDSRRRAGLTQAQLASAVSMTRSSIANLEAGRQRIPLHVLIWMAEVLKVEPTDLLPESPMFGGLLIMPDLTEQLADAPEGMRSFVQSTIAKGNVPSRESMQ